MPKWKKPVKQLFRKTRWPLVKFKLWLKQRMGWLGVPVIVPYLGFGNEQQVTIRGSVMEDKGISHPEYSDSIWQNMLDMLKRYVSDELPGVTIRANFNGQVQEMETDEDGMFSFTFQCSAQDSGWKEVKFELMDEVVPRQEEITATGEVLLPGPSRFGIISDIDDTILISHATQFFKKIRLMLVKNALTRKPFEGAAAFYRALHDEQDNFNPIFYVSSSEWNIYDLLLNFCNAQNIPKGPFLLEKFEPALKDLFAKGEHSHKLNKIRRLMRTYPDMKFILIGDSGQKDAELYSQMALEFKERILAIYIRDVSKKSRDRKVIDLAEELKRQNVEMLLVKNTEEAARHALEKGFINEAALREVIEERKMERQLDYLPD